MLELDRIDSILTVSDEEAMQGAGAWPVRKVCSAGSAVARPWLRLCGWARTAMAGKRLVVMLAGYGERYLSTPMFGAASQLPARRDGQL